MLLALRLRVLDQEVGAGQGHVLAPEAVGWVHQVFCGDSTLRMLRRVARHKFTRALHLYGAVGSRSLLRPGGCRRNGRVGYFGLLLVEGVLTGSQNFANRSCLAIAGLLLWPFFIVQDSLGVPTFVFTDQSAYG